MEKCNHPNCVNGVMHEELFLGVIVMKRCDYCIHDEQSIEEHIAEIKAQRKELEKQFSEVLYGN